MGGKFAAPAISEEVKPVEELISTVLERGTSIVIGPVAGPGIIGADFATVDAGACLEGKNVRLTAPKRIMRIEARAIARIIFFFCSLT